MIWHVVFAELVGLPQSRAARSRDAAIQVACELLDESYDVRRIIEPNGPVIERPQIDRHYDGGRFPGLRRNMLAQSPPNPGWNTNGISLFAFWQLVSGAGTLRSVEPI